MGVVDVFMTLLVSWEGVHSTQRSINAPRTEMCGLQTYWYNDRLVSLYLILSLMCRMRNNLSCLLIRHFAARVSPWRLLVVRRACRSVFLLCCSFSLMIRLSKIVETKIRCFDMLFFKFIFDFNLVFIWINLNEKLCANGLNKYEI